MLLYENSLSLVHFLFLTFFVVCTLFSANNNEVWVYVLSAFTKELIVCVVFELDVQLHVLTIWGLS